MWTGCTDEKTMNIFYGCALQILKSLDFYEFSVCKRELVKMVIVKLDQKLPQCFRRLIQNQILKAGVSCQ